MADKYPMTPMGHERLKAELRKLTDVDRPANAKAIEVARAHGDISENADYSAAKEEQGMIEAKIRELTAKVALAEVIDPTTLSGDRVMFGATVTVEEGDTGETKTYTIVGDDEGDLKRNRISISSPVARALIGRSVGDSVTIRTPKGAKEVDVVEVAFAAIDL